MKTQIIEKIKQLRTAKKNTDSSDEVKKMKTEILALRLKLENVVLTEITNIQINPKNSEELTEKQQSFYIDIFDYLKKWTSDKAQSYIQLDRLDRKIPSKENIKITVKRIGELLTAEWTKSSFSKLADEYKWVKDGNMFAHNGKYGYLRKDM